MWHTGKGEHPPIRQAEYIKWIHPLSHSLVDGLASVEGGKYNEFNVPDQSL